MLFLASFVFIRNKVLLFMFSYELILLGSEAQSVFTSLKRTDGLKVSTGRLTELFVDPSYGVVGTFGPLVGSTTSSSYFALSLTAPETNMTLLTSQNLTFNILDTLYDASLHKLWLGTTLFSKPPPPLLLKPYFSQLEPLEALHSLRLTLFHQMEQ